MNPNQVFAFVVNPTTGALTAVPGSPFATNGTGSCELGLDAAGQYLFVSNQASNDVSVFAVNANGSLTLVAGSPFPAGTGTSGLSSVTYVR